MDDRTRIIIASIIGLGLGLLLGYLTGDFTLWIIVCLALLIATDSALRTMKNVKAPPNRILSRTQNKKETVPSQKPRSRKPLEPKF